MKEEPSRSNENAKDNWISLRELEAKLICDSILFAWIYRRRSVSLWGKSDDDFVNDSTWTRYILSRYEPSVKRQTIVRIVVSLDAYVSLLDTRLRATFPHVETSDVACGAETKSTVGKDSNLFPRPLRRLCQRKCREKSLGSPKPVPEAQKFCAFLVACDGKMSEKTVLWVQNRKTSYKGTCWQVTSKSLRLTRFMKGISTQIRGPIWLPAGPRTPTRNICEVRKIQENLAFLLGCDATIPSYRRTAHPWKHNGLYTKESCVSTARNAQTIFLFLFCFTTSEHWKGYNESKEGAGTASPCYSHA